MDAVISKFKTPPQRMRCNTKNTKTRDYMLMVKDTASIADRMPTFRREIFYPSSTVQMFYKAFLGHFDACR